MTRRVQRGLVVALVGGGLLVGAVLPAAAQGDPVGGSGNHWYLAGAGNESGRATLDFTYGDPRDEVYFGDFVNAAGAFGGDGVDDAMVRRGNTFIIRGQAGRSFVYGDPGDTVLVGDWNGDGADTLAVRRGNRYFVKNDVSTGKADYEFVYGDPGDAVLVGDWDGDRRAEGLPPGVLDDTLAVRRGNHFFIKNTTTTGVADYEFRFGDPGDTVLVGDWGWPPQYGDNPDTPARETDHVLYPGASGDKADQLAIRRGNVYSLSEETFQALGYRNSVYAMGSMRSFAYGNPTDTAFSAQLSSTYQDRGLTKTLTGDGLAVRRNG